jgi:predicted AAA+ superfamily ATPase
MYIRQKQLDNLRQFLSPGKVVVLYGARRTGKTTLVEEFLKEIKEPFLFVSGDDITVQEFLATVPGTVYLIIGSCYSMLQLCTYHV